MECHGQWWEDGCRRSVFLTAASRFICGNTEALVASLVVQGVVVIMEHSIECELRMKRATAKGMIVSKAGRFVRCLLFVIGFALVYSPLSYGQGTISKTKRSFVGYLDFHANRSTGPNRVGLQSDSHNPFRADKWLDQRNGIAGRGLVQEATLRINWWSLLGDAVCSDLFFWKSSGWYEIHYTDSKTGQAVTRQISRSGLGKYPDLVKRFDALAPDNMNFEVEFSLGSVDTRKYETFRRKHNLLESIGSAMPYLKSTFTHRILQHELLFERSGVSPIQAPQSVTWTEYLGLSQDYDKGKLGTIREFWSIVSDLKIRMFRVTRMEWPLGEMRAIAEAFERRERGDEDPSPKRLIASADSASQHLKKYAANDEWREPLLDDNPEADISSEKGFTYLRSKGQTLATFNSRNGVSVSPWSNGGNRPITKKFFLSSTQSQGQRPYSVINAKGRTKRIAGYDKFNMAYVKEDGNLELVIYLSNFVEVKELFVPLGARKAPGGLYTTRADARRAINNYSASGVGFRWTYGIRDVKVVVVTPSLRVISTKIMCQAGIN